MGRIEQRAITFSVVANAILFLLLGSVSFSGCFAKREEIIPMEFLVVTEENAADRLAEEPNEAKEEPEPPEPEPLPEPPPPIPEPPPPPPMPDPDPIPPPKPVEKPQPKPEKPKPAEKKPEAPKKPKWKPTPVKISKERVGPVTTGKKNRTKAATQKALSEAEIRKLLAAGAKPGNKNQTPPNEASRCYGIIAAAFRDACNAAGLEPSPTGKDPTLKVVFGAGGAIKSIALKASSGNPRHDTLALEACRTVRRVSGLSQGFLESYQSVDIRLNIE